MRLSRQFLEAFPMKQSNLYGQPNIQRALDHLYEWMDRVTNCDSISICTWFGDALGNVLPREAYEKRMTYRRSLKHWINVQKVVEVGSIGI